MESAFVFEWRKLIVKMQVTYVAREPREHKLWPSGVDSSTESYFEHEQSTTMDEMPPGILRVLDEQVRMLRRLPVEGRIELRVENGMPDVEMDMVVYHAHGDHALTHWLSTFMARLAYITFSSVNARFSVCYTLRCFFPLGGFGEETTRKAGATPSWES